MQLHNVHPTSRLEYWTVWLVWILALVLIPYSSFVLLRDGIVRPLCALWGSAALWYVSLFRFFLFPVLTLSLLRHWVSFPSM